MVIATTRTIARFPHLATFLADHPRAVAGWGRKPSGQRATRMARLFRRGFVLLEDGFIRSVERDSLPLSLLVDDIGVYYDASAPSRMETTIAAGIEDDAIERARALVTAWRDGSVSKYNHNPDYDGYLPDRYVLVADQTFGDLSISGGLADDTSFSAMLAAAITENPDATIIVKVHPDVLSGRRRGHFTPDVVAHPQVQLIAADCHPARLLRHAAAVYAVTSLIGFEALLWGKPVRCFGMPFYAGWGLTDDALPSPVRRHRTRIEDVVHAALVSLARYASPQDGEPWQVEEAIAYVAQRREALFPSAAPATRVAASPHACG